AGEGWYGGGEQVGFRTVVFGCAVARGFRQGTQAVDVDRLAVAEQGKDDRQADSDLGGGDDDDEQRQHLAAVEPVTQPHVEGDEVEVDGVEHQLDRHQHEDRVAPGEHAVDADGEQERGNNRRIDDVH